MRYKIFKVCVDPIQKETVTKTTPCVVISPDVMNDNLNSAIVAPLTHSIKGIPFRPLTSYNGYSSAIALDQTKTISKTRLIQEMGHLSPTEIQAVKKALYEMYQ